MRKHTCLRLLLVSSILYPLATGAGQVEATFNDLFTGSMQTDLVGGPNEGNLDTGSGFAESGYTNATDVVEVIAGDVAIPAGISNYSANSDGAGGKKVGVVNGTVFRRAQERMTTPLTGDTVWFSFLAELTGTDAEAHLVFNVDNNTTGGASGGFGVLCGDNNLDGCLAVITDTTKYVGGTPPQTGFEFYDAGGGTYTNILTIGGSDLIIGRVDVDDAGTDTVNIWINPADVLDLGPADLVVVDNLVGSAGITSVSFEFVRRTSAAASALDHVRVSDASTGQLFVTGNPIDPVFKLAAGSPDSDLDFGTTYTTAANLSRTLLYEVESTSGTATVTVDDLVLTDDPAAPGAFTLGTVTPSVPVTLNDGDTIEIEVIANASSGSFNGSLLIDTTAAGGNVEADDYDTTFPIQSTFLADGEKLNPNPYMDANVGPDWGGGSTRVEPGIAPGSIGMARVKGIGDPAGDSTNSLYQATSIRDGLENWAFTSYFTPIDVINWLGYTGEAAPGGEFTDRTFQWALLSADAPAVNPDLGDPQAANTIINLAYLPAGDAPGGTAGFYVYDGVADEWVDTGIGPIDGSVDNDTDGDPSNGFGDGLLDTTVDPLDVVNTYQLTVSGTGFGSGGSATYDITVTKVSGPDSFTSESATNLSTYHGMDPSTNAPSSFAFTTSDTSLSSNADAGYTTTFWVDDTCYLNGSVPDSALVILTQPGAMSAFEPDTGDSTTFRVRNDGASSGLTIDPLVFTSPGFSASTPPGLAPAEFADLSISFDSLTGGSAAEEIVTLTSDATLASAPTILVSASATSFSNLLPNFDFEAPGTDPAGDTNTFAIWNEAANAGGDTGDPTLARDVPGLIAGSATACLLDKTANSATISNQFGIAVTDFVAELYFAIKDTANRQLSLIIRNETGAGSQINLRYEDGGFAAYSTTWNSLFAVALDPSIDDDGDGSLEGLNDTKNVYKLRITGTGFGTNPLYSVEVFDTDDNLLGATPAPVSFFQNGNGFSTGSRAGSIFLGNQYGDNPGWWADDLSVSGAIITDTSIAVTAISKSGNTVSLDFTAAGNVDVYKSLDLTGFGATPIMSNVAPGTAVAVDTAATEAAAFYALVPTGDPAP